MKDNSYFIEDYKLFRIIGVTEDTVFAHDQNGESFIYPLDEFLNDKLQMTKFGRWSDLVDQGRLALDEKNRLAHFIFIDSTQEDIDKWFVIGTNTLRTLQFEGWTIVTEFEITENKTDTNSENLIEKIAELEKTTWPDVPLEIWLGLLVGKDILIKDPNGYEHKYTITYSTRAGLLYTNYIAMCESRKVRGAVLNGSSISETLSNIEHDIKVLMAYQWRRK